MKPTFFIFFWLLLQKFTKFDGCSHLRWPALRSATNGLILMLILLIYLLFYFINNNNLTSISISGFWKTSKGNEKGCDCNKHRWVLDYHWWNCFRDWLRLCEGSEISNPRRKRKKNICYFLKKHLEANQSPFIVIIDL